MNLISFFLPSYRLFEKVDERLLLFYRASFRAKGFNLKQPLDQELEFESWILLERLISQSPFDDRRIRAFLCQPQESLRLWVHGLMGAIVVEPSSTLQKSRAEQVLKKLVCLEVLEVWGRSNGVIVHKTGDIGVHKTAEPFRKGADLGFTPTPTTMIGQFRISGSQNFETSRGEPLAYFVSEVFPIIPEVEIGEAGK